MRPDLIDDELEAIFYDLDACVAHLENKCATPGWTKDELKILKGRRDGAMKARNNLMNTIGKQQEMRVKAVWE